MCHNCHNKHHWEILQLPKEKDLSRYDAKKRYKIKHRIKIRNYITEYKRNKKCTICNEGHPGCLTLHHVDPKEKSFNVTNGLDKSLDTVKKK